MTTRDWLVAAMTAVSAVLLIIGIAGLISGDDDQQVATDASPTTTTSSEPNASPNIAG